MSESEWEDILQSLFQLKPLPDIQSTATVEADTSIAITIRKIVQGTTVRFSQSNMLIEWALMNDSIVSAPSP